MDFLFRRRRANTRVAHQSKVPMSGNILDTLYDVWYATRNGRESTGRRGNGMQHVAGISHL